MLGQDRHAATGGGGQRSPQDREALAEACRGVRERLDAIARALAALVTEIDRTLERGSALPETATDAPRASSSAD